MCGDPGQLEQLEGDLRVERGRVDPRPPALGRRPPASPEGLEELVHPGGTL